MALSGAERLIVFEILDFPPPDAPGSVSIVSEMWGTFGRDMAVQAATFNSLVQRVDAYISGSGGFGINALTSDKEDRVRFLINEWLSVSTSELMVESAEGAKGVLKDSSAKRALIRHRLQVYIPVYLENEIRNRHQSLAMGGGNWIQRG